MAPYITQDSTPSSPSFPSSESPLAMTSSVAPSTNLVTSNGHAPQQIQDLLCIGFGPASLAVAIALREKFTDEGDLKPNVAYLEKQPEFAWHAGMLLPGSKMQISFIKDLATLRNPRSYFTFLNYLHQHDRLVQFTNLGTFLPSRIEFEDYMKWCADHFKDLVQYGQEVLDVRPGNSDVASGKVSHFSVTSRNLFTNQIETRHARNVIIAVGGRARIPAPFPAHHPRVIHSSAYQGRVDLALPDKEKPYRIAVVGNGQSGAEIFNALNSRYPNSETYMIIKDTALRPSDDSPFVNEVFNPERVDSFYAQPETTRSQSILSDKSTNYGVVRLELIEHIYSFLYEQRIRSPNEQDWKHRILPSRQVAEVDIVAEKGPLRLHLQNVLTGQTAETLEVDAIFVATGYLRDGHEEMMKPLAGLEGPISSSTGKWFVHRNYKVDLDETKVENGAGIWLQGCNQGTHGLADSLLSILAVRGGEVVDSMFGTL